MITFTPAPSVKKLGVRFVDDWLFRNKENPEIALPGFIVLLSQNRPKTAGLPGFDWFDFDESVGGMASGTLMAYAALDLCVSKEILDTVLKQTDWSEGVLPDSGWRHDLSWHNTKMDGPHDPTVKAYLAAIAPLGLTWTVPSNLSAQPYGIKLAQAAYPFDATDANLRALRVSDSIQRLLGGPADPSVHSIVLLTPNDD